MAERTGFIMHFENFKYFSRLSDEQLGALFRALCSYAENGTEPDFTDDVTDIIFELLRDRMDRDAEKYKEVCQRNAQNARKGGRPRKTERVSEEAGKTERFLEKPEKPNPEPDPDPDPEPDPEPVCDPDAACAAPAAPDAPHTPHTAEELTVGWVLEHAGSLGCVWTQEEAEDFIAYNRDRGRRDGWDYAMTQWEKNRPRKAAHTAKPAADSSGVTANMDKYLSLVNRFQEDNSA